MYISEFEVQRKFFGHFRSIKVLAKIENLESLLKLEEIVDASDGIMVARGDLGVEIPLEQIPAVQEKITHVCRQLNKPVIVASQLLESMVEFPTPTRAEVVLSHYCYANVLLLFRRFVLSTECFIIQQYLLCMIRLQTFLKQLDNMLMP